MKDSFFDIFEYSVLVTDGIDSGYIYEDVTITKYVVIESVRVLGKGNRYDAVWFHFDRALFQFVNYNKNDDNEWIMNPDTSVEISQSELSKFLVWE